MKISVPALFICFALLAGCHKNDVDIAELNTNPFDRDHPGESPLFTLEPIQTVAYGQGTLYKHTVVIHVYPERFPAATNYTISSNGSMGISGQGDNTFLGTKYLITLGTEYCYRFELRVGGEVVAAQEQCAMAEL